MRISRWELGEALGFDSYQANEGTCHCMFQIGSNFINIIAIMNEDPGNGDFKKLMDQMELHASDNDKSVMVCEFWNKKLRKHFIRKRGYRLLRNGNVIKEF